MNCPALWSILGALLSAAAAAPPAPPPARSLATPPAEESVALAEGFELAPAETRQLRFTPPQVPAGKELLLALSGRLQSPRPGGYTPALRLRLNGRTIEGARAVNWLAEELTVGGRVMRVAAHDTFNTPYAPDFDSINRSPVYALQSGPKLCRWELRLTDLLTKGENVLVVENGVAPALDKRLVVAEVRLLVRAVQAPPARRPAPTGPLAVIRPTPVAPLSFAVKELPDAALEVAFAGETLSLRSEFSTPRPAWTTASNDYFEHRRSIVRLDEAIVVRDRFVNRTNEVLPLIHRHRLLYPRGWKRVWVAGLSPQSMEAKAASPAHPTAFGATATAAVGLLALDDVTQVHVETASGRDRLELCDPSLVLRPGATHESEWAIVLAPRPDYFALVNAVRRLRQANFTLEGSFAFLRAHPRTIVGQWSDDDFRDFIRRKSARFVCSSAGYPGYQGNFPHGTAFQQVDFSYMRRQIARLNTVAPDAVQMVYFHTFIDSSETAPTQYADARLLLANAAQGVYDKSCYPIFVPTEENAFGREVRKNVELILGPPPAGFGCRGVYWDEMEYSRYRYSYGDFNGAGLPWDGVSADINQQTLRVGRLKTSVALVSQPFRVGLAKRILQQHALVANGQPHTRTMAALRFPRFVETGSISHCVDAQLFSPIALGDHLTERSEADAYAVMRRALDFGCVYYWYNDVTVVPTHEHLTAYMFPITPVELGEGYIIGRERIVTNRSGLYGFGDDAEHEVHVFAADGREAKDFSAPRLRRDGQSLTELRLPEGFSAAIVRRGP